ncbi:MAG: NFACT RNA binding domain-containing protein [Candidatus Gastranaerophilales bacterium]
MINFDSLTLKAFVEESENFLTGARIQKIQQPTRRDFIFTIRNNGETKKFYVNINPQFHHLCFMNKANEQKRLIEIPQKPPMFCMLLRKYIENAKIYKINQPQYERILEFYIETYNELSEKIYFCLAFELMGKHSNVVLYNHDTNVIIGCAHNVGAEKSREREMAGMLPYIYPPKQHKADILNYNGEINFETLSKDFYWFSKSFATQCNNRTLNEIKNFVSLKNLAPSISKDFKEFGLFSSLIPNNIEFQSVNEMIDEYFAHHIEQNKISTLKSNLLSNLNAKLKKHNSSLNKMQTRLKKEEIADENRLFADLIMTNLYTGKDYSNFIEVYDYENDKNIQIQLDSQLTLKENANKFYKLYRKSKTSINKLGELIKDTKTQIEYLAQTIYSIEIANTAFDLFDIIKSEIEPTTQKTEKLKPASVQDLEILGYKVYVGKNNRQNDIIISKLSKEDDWWFHVREGAGSHVLLKLETNKQEPTDELIFECAKLAKEFSSLKNSAKAGIIYTKRKYIKKPPKANLGYVTYKNEKEIVV